MITLDNDEHIVLEVRKHWFVLFAESMPLIFFALLPALIAIAYRVLGFSEIFVVDKHPQELVTLLAAVWLLFLWIAFFMMWTDYYLDILILTNKRIIEIEQKALFSREISTFRLDRIQDVTVEVSGIIATFLNFGDIHIQTAGEVPEITVRGIPHPHNMREIVSQAQDKAIERSRIVKVDGTE